MAKLFLLGLGSTAVIGGGIGTGIYFGVGFGNGSTNQEERGGETETKLEHEERQAASGPISKPEQRQAPSRPDNVSRKSEPQEVP